MAAVCTGDIGMSGEVPSAGADPRDGGAIELSQRMDSARLCVGQEADFWRALLAAPIWAISVDGLWHCIKHPDGFEVVPFYTCAQRAREAAPFGARLVRSVGRVWLQAVSNSVVMLEPGHGGCLLVPAEVALLLKCGTLPPICRSLWAGEPDRVHRASAAPAALVALLRAELARLRDVEAAYLVEAAAPDEYGVHRPVLVLVVSAPLAERAARACLARLAPTSWAKRGLHVTAHNPTEAMPAFLRRCHPRPIFVRQTTAP